MAVFLRKEPEWNQPAGGPDSAAGAEAVAGEAGGGPAAENKGGVMEGSAAENAVQQTFPEVITSLDEIHEVGTLAQVSEQVAERALQWPSRGCFSLQQTFWIEAWNPLVWGKG